jgi:16S rRNA C1402 (ribose-2'-O) methylase RsmI
LVERPIITARELTKVYEQWSFLTADSPSGTLPEPKGEFVIVIAPAAPAAEPKRDVTDDEISDLFGQIANLGIESRRQAIKTVAERLHLAPKAVYAALERAKQAAERIG